MAKQLEITHEHILHDLKEKRYKPVYLLQGEEPYYIDIISDYIQDKILDESQREFDLAVIYGKETDITQVINAAKRFPMMSERQIIIVKEAQNIKELDKLQHYIQNPSPSTILVICYKYGTVDGRKKWVSDLKKTGVVYESKKFRDYEMTAWITQYARERNLSMDEKAIFMISDFLGTDLSKVANEMNKLIITKPADLRKITPEFIEKNIGISKDYNVFELQDALIAKDVLKANRIINYFADNKKSNPLVVVLSQMFQFFSNLMMYHYLPDKSPEKVASELKIHPFIARNYQKAASTFNAWKTMNIITYIREADASSKGINNVSADESDILKELIFKILH